MIDELIKKENIRVNCKIDNWQESIRIAGDLLLENDSIQKKYIKAMIDVVKEKGPYIVIAPGIAIAHARPEDGVNNLCMSMITLESPIDFGNKENDPVKVVFAFGTTDDKEHIKTFRELTQLLMRDNFIKDIDEMETVKEVLDYIKS